MGKRELLLIVAFVILGSIVYQATAPPSGPNEHGFSFSRLVESVRKHVRGNRASAEVITNILHPIDAKVTEVRLVGTYAEILIEGGDRGDIETKFRVNSTGSDDAEANRLAKVTALTVDRAATMLAFRVEYPKEGRQRAFLSLKVPSRLRVRVDDPSSRVAINNVAAVELAAARGETSIRQIAGRAVVTHRSGHLMIDDVASLKLVGRGSDAVVKGVRGEASFVFEQGGELTISEIGGPLDADTRSADLTFTLERTRGPIRVNAVGGTVVVKGLGADARIDGREVEMEVDMAQAAPVTIYNDGENIELAPPPGGFRLDALATEGRISVPDDMLAVAEGDSEQRASGAVRGGGPVVTLRATRGNITIREVRSSNPER